MLEAMKDDRIVFYKGERVLEDERGVVRIITPTNVTAGDFARAFSPLIKEATRLGMA